jgi:8-oxo-dGTP pyrophosphatase MutT (NUDIX family)
LLRQVIRKQISGIIAGDRVEQDDIAEALAWIDSGVELCRIEKPATPPMHLVSYCVVLNQDRVLLVDHKKAGLWLPTGGHVDQGEYPRHAAERELLEELGVVSEVPFGAPFMITCQTTVGLTAGHRDVSLWYLARVAESTPLRWDRDEFNDIRWFSMDQVPLERADPCFERFARKLAEHYPLARTLQRV